VIIRIIILEHWITLEITLENIPNVSADIWIRIGTSNVFIQFLL